MTESQFVMHISTCSQCGVENDTVQWRYLNAHGGILVGILCAICAERIETEEREKAHVGNNDE